MGDKRIATPKQPPVARGRDWYPYYAGFTEAFVDGVLTSYFRDSDRMLDPWSGSGTTVAVCARRSIASVGLDINPALTVIAKARLTPIETKDSLGPVSNQIIELARSTSVKDNSPNDLLTVWLRPSAARRLRSIQTAIHAILVSDGPPSDPRQVPRFADNLPVLACFFYTALFATVRQLLARFRGTNPTWFVEPKTSRHRISPGWNSLAQEFEESVRLLCARIRVPAQDTSDNSPTIVTGSATQLPFATGFFDGALTSPPYATRIDYVRNVLAELAILGADRSTIDALRQLSTGSPVIRGGSPNEGGIESRCARKILADVSQHPSKGSAGYYWPWLHKYLCNLQAGLLETVRVTSVNHRVAVVVQDSHYKELHVDLQTIVTETLASAGRRPLARHDYASRRLYAHMNPHARRHLRDRRNVESLLIFH